MRMYPRVKDETGKNDIDNNSVDEIENANNSDKDKDKDDSKPISELAEYFKNYTTKKSLSNLLMDGALLAYNAAQLRVLFVGNVDRDALWIISLVLTLISIIAQLTMGIILGILARSNTDPKEKEGKTYIDHLNDIVLALTGIISAINIMLNVFVQVDFSDFLKKK